MTRQLFIWTIFSGLLVMSGSCNGQLKTNSPKDSLAKQKTSLSGQPKVVKNYFISQYPQTYWYVQCGLQDKAGNLWFGTNADGVYCYDGTSFTNYTRKDGLCNNDVLCMLEDKSGMIWFGTRGGLCRYKPNAGKTEKKSFKIIPVSVKTSLISDRTDSIFSGGFASNFVWSIMQDKTGRIWFGTNEGVYFCDPAIDSNNDAPVSKLFLNNDGIINNNKLKLKVVQKIVEDKKGNIWFASGDIEAEGICCYDGKSVINFKPGEFKSFRSILQTQSGDLLFLTNSIFTDNQVVYRYDGKGFTNFTEKIGLTKEHIIAMLEDKNGNLWFGSDNNSNTENTGNSGAWCYDGNSLKLFTTKEGLSHNGVFCIVQDSNENIWFGTRNTGLCRYDGKTFTDFTE